MPRSPVRPRRPLGRAESYLDAAWPMLDDEDYESPSLGAASDVLQGAGDSRCAIAWSAVAVVCAMVISVVPFELLNKADRGCSSFIFFGQVAYAALECLLSGGVRRFLCDRKIPIGYHLCGLAFERGRAALYNGALDRGLPMPVYLVIKNSGLVVSLCLGWAVQRRSYSRKQVAGALLITAGVIASTLASRPASSTDAVPGADAGCFVFATTLMAAGTLATSAMNVMQEWSFEKHGKHFQETMFYTHVLMLPVLLVDSEGLWAHATVWASRWDRLPLPGPLGVQAPTLWLLLLVNIVAQSAMKVSCLKLTALGGQVSNVVVVTVARFTCLVVSAVCLNAPPMPSASFWLGGLLVLVGTLSYVLAGPACPAPAPSCDKKVQ